MKKKHIIHGCSRTKEYISWQGMHARCKNSNNPGFKNYGGRGIKVCERWENSFLNFLQDMGPKPSKDHSLDRIDNNGNYEPSNCRWATQYEQGNNRRNNIFIEHNGKSRSVAEWSRILNLSPLFIKREVFIRNKTIEQLYSLDLNSD
jgi:hypothetical protein